MRGEHGWLPRCPGRETRWRARAAAPGGREPQSNHEGRRGAISGPSVHVLAFALRTARPCKSLANSTVFPQRPLLAEGRRAQGPELLNHPTRGRLGN